MKHEFNSTLERNFNEGLDVSDIEINNEIQVRPAANRIGSVIIGGGSVQDDAYPGQGTTLELRSLNSILDSVNSGSESPKGDTGSVIRKGKAIKRYHYWLNLIS